MNRSINYESNTSAHSATADDETANHDSARDFFAAAYRGILLKVWDDDAEMRRDIEEHITSIVPLLVSVEEYKKKIQDVRRCFDGAVFACENPENVWFFRDKWNLFECVTEKDGLYHLFVWQTTE